MDDYEPQYVPFTAPVAPEDKKKSKKEKPKKEKPKKEKPKKEKPKKEKPKKEKPKKEKPKKEKPEKEKPEKEKPEKAPPKKKKPSKMISPGDIKTYTWQMEKFQIMLADGKDILIALMLDSAPSEPIREALLKFATQFANNYSTEIENYRGNVAWFRSATEIADDSFNMFLMRPQCLPLTEEELKKIKLTETEMKIMRVAQDISKDTGYFFLATLLDEVLKRFKMPQERVLKSFFTLNRKEAFLPIQIEAVGQEVDKRKLWKQIVCVEGLSDDECNLLMEDLLDSNEESRINLLSKLTEAKKRTRGIIVREEVVRRRQFRKERDELFKKVDEFLKLNDYNEVVLLFDKIVDLSLKIGETSVAQELTNRAQAFRQELDQMAQRIPALRSQRNEALNQAELLELSGRYDEAAKQFEYASSLSSEIGEIDKAKDFLSQAERLKSLSELAKLREKLR